MRGEPPVDRDLVDQRARALDRLEVDDGPAEAPAENPLPLERRGLPHRSSMFGTGAPSYLDEELARARRDQTGIVCLMLDIDHFKRVNDTWGHAAGDAVLRELALRIESQVRASDVAARFGGEEFVVLLPNTEATSAKLLAERIRAAISRTPFDLPGGVSVTVTVSIGISEVLPGPENRDLKTLGDSLIARADVALYAAKSAGRDRVIVEAA